MLDNAGPAHGWLQGKGLDEAEGRGQRLQNDRRIELMRLLPEVYAPGAIPDPSNG